MTTCDCGCHAHFHPDGLACNDGYCDVCGGQGGSPDPSAPWLTDLEEAQ